MCAIVCGCGCECVGVEDEVFRFVTLVKVCLKCYDCTSGTWAGVFEGVSLVGGIVYKAKNIVRF